MWRIIYLLCISGVLLLCNFPSTTGYGKVEYYTVIPIDYEQVDIVSPVKYFTCRIIDNAYRGEEMIDTLRNAMALFSARSAGIEQVRFELNVWDRVGRLVDTIIEVPESVYVS
jgi:hypothetical protein